MYQYPAATASDKDAKSQRAEREHLENELQQKTLENEKLRSENLELQKGITYVIELTVTIVPQSFRN